MPVIGIDRAFIGRSLFFALLLLWPLLVFGRPAYMPDSAAYQMGGERAVSFVMQRLDAGPPSGPAEAERQAGLSSPPAQDDDTKVARSIPYSVLAYVLRGPGVTMVHMALFHALTMALMITALFEGVAGRGLRGFLVMAGITSLATGLAPTVGFIVPDCYAAVVLGVMMILPFRWSRFSGPMRALLLLGAIFGVAVHPSHPPVALGVALAASPALWLFRIRLSERLITALCALWSPPMLGTALVMLTGLVGFGQVSIAPKHFPLALARAIENGPARAYLVEACRESDRYAICELYGTQIPRTAWALLWSKDSIVNRATPEQMDRVRAEEQAILLETAKRFPGDQARHILRDVPLQLVTYRLDYLNYASEIVRNDQGGLVVAGFGEGAVPPLYRWLDLLAHVSVAGGTLYLMWAWRRMPPDHKAMVLMLVLGLLANAAVCAIFSGVASRYQARVIWLVPYVAVAIGVALPMQRRCAQPGAFRK